MGSSRRRSPSATAWSSSPTAAQGADVVATDDHHGNRASACGAPRHDAVVALMRGSAVACGPDRLGKAQVVLLESLRRAYLHTVSAGVPPDVLSAQLERLVVRLRSPGGLVGEDRDDRSDQ